MFKILIETAPEAIQVLDSQVFKASIEQLATLINQIEAVGGNLELDEVTLSINVSAQGEVIVLNGGQGAMTLKFKRSLSSQLSQSSQSSKNPQINYKKLENSLSASRWQEANQETWNLLCVALDKKLGSPLTGSDLEQIPCAVLNNIDKLWHKHSNGKYGFTVQNRIYKEIQSHGK